MSEPEPWWLFLTPSYKAPKPELTPEQRAAKQARRHVKWDRYMERKQLTEAIAKSGVTVEEFWAKGRAVYVERDC